MKTKRDKLKEILRAINGESIDFSAFDSAVATLRKSLEEKVAIPTIERVDAELESFKKKLDITPLLTALEEVKKTVGLKITGLTLQMESKIKEQKISEIEALNELDSTFNKALDLEINSLRVQIASLDVVGSKDLAKVEEEIKKLIKEIKFPPDREEEIKKVSKELDATRIDLINRINQKGGGNMNRSIFIGGVNAVAKYTDINLKAGSNVTLTYVNNNTTKKVDITIASSGGGGGSTRSVQSISADQTLDSASGTDYVYICSGTITLTMPTGSGNSNLYTIKNAGTGVITILPDGTDTLDNDISIIMPVRYTSVDLISDSVANWNIT